MHCRTVKLCFGGRRRNASCAGRTGAATPTAANLYARRLLRRNSRSNFVAAENDWKLRVEKAKEQVPAQWDFADFLSTPLRPQDETRLRVVGDSPSAATSDLRR